MSRFIGAKTGARPGKHIQAAIDGKCSYPDEVVIDATEEAYSRVNHRLAPYYAHYGASKLPLLHDCVPSVFLQSRPALGGYASALGVATWYQSFGLHLNDKLHAARASVDVSPFPTPSYGLRALDQIRSAGYDVTLQRDSRYAAGFMTNLSLHGMPPTFDSAFGHLGWSAASIGLYDPASDLAISIVHSEVDETGDKGRAITRAILDLVSVEAGLA